MSTFNAKDCQKLKQLLERRKNSDQSNSENKNVKKERQKKSKKYAKGIQPTSNTRFDISKNISSQKTTNKKVSEHDKLKSKRKQKMKNKPNNDIATSREAEFRRNRLAVSARQQLAQSKFRSINQYLYSNPANGATSYMDEELFATYHNTYESLVENWPLKPIDFIVDHLRLLISGDARVGKRIVKGESDISNEDDITNESGCDHAIDRGKSTTTALARTKKKCMKSMAIKKSINTVADVGCGRSAIVRRNFPHLNVYSFDLISDNADVTAANMCELPLNRSSCDCAVYCLSLMAINLKDCLREANRILVKGGHLLIAEVSSRFGDKPDGFITALKRFGFRLQQRMDLPPNNYFVFFHFVKCENRSKSDNLPDLSLLPCIYKPR